MTRGTLEKYVKLLVNNEDWLFKKLINFRSYPQPEANASSIEDTCRNSIYKISDACILTAKSFGLYSPEILEAKFRSINPVVLYGASEAIFFKRTGLGSIAFLEMLKYYRHAYFELINASGINNNYRNDYLLFTDQCFDLIESGFLEKWKLVSEDLNFKAEPAMESEVMKENYRYRAAFENFFAPIILLDEKNLIIDYNNTTSKYFDNLKISGGLSDDKPFLAGSLGEVLGHLNDFVAHGQEVLCFETYLETSRGKKYFQVLLSKILDVEKKLRGTVIMLNDLTLRNETEQHLQNAKAKAEEADKLKTAFLANMSHEIRTPMNAILGFTELMLNSNYNSGERKEYLELIRRSSADLLNIIEDIIDIAKLESKQLKIKYAECTPYTILTDLLAVFQQTLRRYGTDKEVALILKVDEKDKKITLYTDGERLKQVISNLLSNAAKFTNMGNIEYGYKAISGSNLFFYVRDTGIGIPEKMKSRIFDRFIQVEEHHTQNMGGAGLGLAICKNIVNLLGGEMWVESIEHKGSDFYFQIPIRDIPQNIKSEKTLKSDSGTEKPYNWNGKLILVAEDDEVNFVYLKEILSRTGAMVLRATNGLEAINIAESEENIDLILMDIKMPEVNGLEATRYITSVRPGLPIIAQTAFAMDGDERKCLAAGCKEYITKPVDQKKLLALLEKYLNVPAKSKMAQSTIKK